jgi:hypothetical protein
MLRYLSYKLVLSFLREEDGIPKKEVKKIGTNQ